MNAYLESPRHDRWIAVAGLVFVGLLIVPIAVGTAPEAEKSDTTILDYYRDSGNQAKQIATAVIIALVGIAIGTAVPATFVFSDTFELDADTARIVLTIGNIWLLSFAGATGSLLVGAVSFASRRTNLLPAWLEWAGLIASPLILLSLPLFGIAAIAVVLWVLALSLVLLVRTTRQRSAS